MIEDILFKLGRKALPSSWYSAISRSFFGRDRGWKRLSTYSSTFEFYKGKSGGGFGNTILEVGSGHQYFTALFFLHAGAKLVHIVDPKLYWDEAKALRELEEFKRTTGSRLTMDGIRETIRCYRNLSEILPAMESQIDFACSFLVLEHVTDLKTLFNQAIRLLKPGGRFCSLVDLSDHTYHVFAKYPILKKILARRLLYHLRYSDRMFELLNDPKCYINRQMLPEYLEIAERAGFQIGELHKEVERNAIIHPDLMRRHPRAPLTDLQVLNFYLELRKVI